MPAYTIIYDSEIGPLKVHCKSAAVAAERGREFMDKGQGPRIFDQCGRQVPLHELEQLVEGHPRA